MDKIGSIAKQNHDAKQRLYIKQSAFEYHQEPVPMVMTTNDNGTKKRISVTKTTCKEKEI